MLIAITPTGGRPDAFALCERWIARQTRKLDLWIVVDDMEPRTKPTMGQVAIAPTTPWDGSGSTQHRNILAALDFIEEQAPGDHDILFVEDDDFYASDYIEKQEERLRNSLIVGEQPARYYHAQHGAYHAYAPTPHASLAATAIRSEMIPALRDGCAIGGYIDMYLWCTHGKRGKLYHDTSVTGIKGMPGRPGVSDAHRRGPGGYWIPDPSGAKLREWIGIDAEAYARFRGSAQPVAPVWVEYENPEGLATFVWSGQTRFRCPEPGCPWDGVSPAAVAKHVRGSHAEDAAPPGETLFDTEQPPERKIILAR